MKTQKNVSKEENPLKNVNPDINYSIKTYTRLLSSLKYISIRIELQGMLYNFCKKKDNLIEPWNSLRLTSIYTDKDCKTVDN